MASAVHKNTETKAASVNVNSVCRRKLPNRDWQLQLRLRRRFNGRWQYAERFRGWGLERP